MNWTKKLKQSLLAWNQIYLIILQIMAIISKKKKLQTSVE